jgi:glutamate-1-semialdehyde 2,1-aminomutase
VKTARSAREFSRARHVLAGGVSSPVRTFRAVGGTPLFIRSGAGAVLADADGNRYVDFCLSWGALILGHAHPRIVREIARQAREGTSYGAPTRLETELALRLRRHFPSCERFRFTSSGTEAVMTAVRLARGATGRTLVVKFEGCYHGHSDGLLAKGGSGLATLGHPASSGVPAGFARETLVLPYNDPEALGSAFRRHGRAIAAVLIEPVAGNMGVISFSTKSSRGSASTAEGRRASPASDRTSRPSAR